MQHKAGSHSFNREIKVSTMATNTDWHQRALELKPESKIFINGAYVDAASGKTFEDIAPHDDRLIAHVASGDVEDIDRAVKSSKKVFDDGTWRFFSQACH